MRYKDKNKIKALHQAVIDVIINEGHHNLSVAKIAKQAMVSPATLYIYYNDKKTMLGQVYLNIKDLIDAKLFDNFDPNGDTETQLKLLLHNYAEALNTYPQEAMVMEVFNDNPNLISDEMYQAGIQMSELLLQFYDNGLRTHQLRKVSPEILITHTFKPFDSIAKIRFANQQQLSSDDINILIDMAWQACKG